MNFIDKNRCQDLKCPRCDFGNPMGVKSCRECGADLTIACTDCGHKVRTGAKFCDECGARLALSQADNEVLSELRSSITQQPTANRIRPNVIKMKGERKNVTVMFTDISGFTQVSEELDPEEVINIINSCFNKLTDGRNYTEPPSGATGFHAAHKAADNKFCINTKNEVMTKYMAQITELSAEAKAIIQRNIEARKQSSKFLRLQPGEKKVLLFVPEKTEQGISEFNGKKSLRFRYTVIDNDSSSRNDNQDQDQEKYFEVSKRTSEDIDTFLLEGHTRLKISRSGSGIDTRYLIVPV